MKIQEVTHNINIKPTKKKVEQAEKFLRECEVLPKEMPIERDVYIRSARDIMDEIRNKIDIALDNMLRK